MLIGLHGKKQAGKDTVHQRIEKLLGPGSKTGATVERVSFADKLYASAAAALGIDVDFLRRWKSDPGVGVAVVSLHDEFHELAPEGISLLGPEPLTIREYLQRYGTEAHRNIFADNFWVDNVNLRDHDRKIVVVTDVRFRNEAQAVLDAGGSIVHVLGPDDVENAGDGHASEEVLPAALIDHVIHNAVRYDNFVDIDQRVLSLMLHLLREERAA